MKGISLYGDCQGARSDTSKYILLFCLLFSRQAIIY